MNTPKPCDSCKNLYYDCLQEDDVYYTAECSLGLELGNITCSKYEHYKEESIKCV